MSLKLLVVSTFLLQSLTLNLAFSNEQTQEPKLEKVKQDRREMESMILLDEMAEALKLCSEKKPLDQKIVLLIMSRIIKGKRYSEDRSAEVKDKVMTMKESSEVKGNMQLESHRLRGISADGNKTITYTRKEMNLADKIAIKLAKYITKKKIKKEGRYFGRCVDALGKERGSCDGSVEKAYQFLTAQDEMSYPKMSLSRQKDRKYFIKGVRKVVITDVVSSCKKKDYKKIKKKCTKFVNELEENRVACKEIKNLTKRKAALLQKIIDSFISSANAGPLDAESVREDIINNARGTSQKWDAFTEGRLALLEVAKNSATDSDAGYQQIANDFQNQVNSSASEMDKLGESNQAGRLNFDFFETDYSLKGVEDIDSVLNKNKFTNKDLAELGSVAADLSKHSLGKNDLQNFVNAYRKSAMTNNSFPNPKYEQILKVSGKTVSMALDKVRDPLSVNGLPKKEQRYMRWAQKRNEIVLGKVSSHLKKIDFNKLRDLKTNAATSLATNSPLEKGIKEASKVDPSSPYLGSSKTKARYNDTSSPLNSYDDEMDEDEGDGEDIDPYGFALSDDKDEDLKIKAMLASQETDPEDDAGFSENRSTTIWKIVSRRYVRSAYPRLMKKRKRRTASKTNFKP